MDLDDLAARLDPAGRYELREKRWLDGCYEGWEAHDRALSRDVAFNLAYGYTDARRFVSSARAVARLCHPNILPVLDLGLVDGRPYFTNPLLHTRSLRELLDPIPRGRDLLHRSVGAIVAAGRALDHARRHGVVLEQVRPDVIRLGEEPGCVFVHDEELGFDSEPASHGDTGRILGYPAYMSPERVRNGPQPGGPPSDVYGLGGVLYYVLYGTPPNHRPGSGTLETLVALAEGSLDLKSRAILRPGFQPRGWGRSLRGLERLCSRALEHDPGRRLPDAGAFSRELEAWWLRNVG